MTTFTKKELLDLNPCWEWKVEIMRWPRNEIDAKEIKETLEKRGRKNYEIVQIMGRSAKMAQAMLDEGVKKDIKDRFDRTPLQIAEKKGFVDAAKVLKKEVKDVSL